LGVNTTTPQALETTNANTGNIQTMFNTWVVCAAACCTLAGILATALRANKPSVAGKEPQWKLEVLQSYSKQLTGDAKKDAYWARKQDEAGLGLPGDGAKLLEAIRAAGLYPAPPTKATPTPSPPPRKAPKQSTTVPSPQSKTPPPQSKPDQAKPKTPSSKPAVTQRPPRPRRGMEGPVIKLNRHNPWAPQASPCRTRVQSRGPCSNGRLHRFIEDHTKALPIKKPFIPKAPAAAETNRHQPTKPIALFSQPARRACMLPLPEPLANMY
jgi:hypothetical protein